MKTLEKVIVKNENNINDKVNLILDNSRVPQGVKNLVIDILLDTLENDKIIFDLLEAQKNNLK